MKVAEPARCRHGLDVVAGVSQTRAGVAEHELRLVRCGVWGVDGKPPGMLFDVLNDVGTGVSPSF